jgi:hypothetical protein
MEDTMESITIDTLDTKLPTLTDNYKLAKTGTLIDKVRSLGFTVDRFVALKTRKVERRGYQKHRVLFSSDALATEHSKEGKIQLLMTNSHDGSSSVTFQLGFFRFICSNGLVAGQMVGEPIRVRHIGKDFDDKLEKAVVEIAARAKLLDEAITKLKNVRLTKEQVKELELKAAQIRYKDNKVVDVEFPLRRTEDQGDGLFEVYNRIQEGLTQGGARVKLLNVETNKVEDKAIRKLRSFVNDDVINSQLFDLAVSYSLAA